MIDDAFPDLLTSKITASFGSGRDDEVLGAMLTMCSALRNQTFLRRFKGDQELLAMVGTLAIQFGVLAKKELDSLQEKAPFSDKQDDLTEIAPFIEKYTRLFISVVILVTHLGSILIQDGSILFTRFVQKSISLLLRYYSRKE